MSSSRTRLSLRLSVAALALTASGLGLAACGSTSSTPVADTTGSTTGPTGDAPADAVTDAPGSAVSAAKIIDVMKTAMTAAKSAHVEMTMSMPTTGDISASGDVAFDPTAEDLTMQVMGRKIEMRLVDQAMYMQMPGLGGGSQWAKIDLSAFSQMGMGGLSAGMTDPMSMVDGLTKAVDKATYVGKDTVDGTSVDHYRMTVDTTKALAQSMPSGIPSGIPGTKVPSSMTEDVFIDSSGHLVEAKVDMGTMGTMTMNMSDYDKPVSVQAPANAKDMSDMMSQLGGALGGTGS